MSGLSSQLDVDLNLNLSDLFSAHPVFLKRVLGVKLSRITLHENSHKIFLSPLMRLQFLEMSTIPAILMKQ